MPEKGRSPICSELIWPVRSISSAELFEVKSTSTGFSHFRNNSSTYAPIYIDNEASNGGATLVPIITVTDGGGNRAGLLLDPNSVFDITGQGGISFSSGGTVGNATEKLRITNLGKVGITSATPASHLDLCASAPEIRITNTATSRAYLSWYNHYGGVKKNANISYNEGNANWEFSLYRADGQANSPYGNIQFFTGSTSSPTLALNITRPGSVTMPKQPCCVMYHSSALTWSSGWTIIPLNNTRFDIGNNFDSGNNRYSIPITGKYAIGCNAEMNIGSGQTWIYFAPRINRNDTTTTNAGINYGDFAPMSNNSSNHYFVYQGHWLANLSQGDTVTFEVHGAGNSFTIANNNQSHYYIYQVA